MDPSSLLGNPSVTWSFGSTERIRTHNIVSDTSIQIRLRFMTKPAAPARNPEGAGRGAVLVCAESLGAQSSVLKAIRTFQAFLLAVPPWVGNLPNASIAAG